MDAMEISWPDEVISLILSKLPQKDIFRFKRLSKFWLQTILTCRLFHHQMVQSLRSNPPEVVPGLLLYANPADYPFQYVENNIHIVPTSPRIDDDPERPTSISIPLVRSKSGSPTYVGVSNGLVCYSNWVNETCSGLVIWNPMRLQSWPVVSPPLPHSIPNLKSSCAFGFAFSEDVKIFKLFLICCNNRIESRVFKCNVYEHPMHWEIALTNAPHSMIIQDKHYVTAHGCLTWLFQREPAFNITSMLCLNIVIEDCEVVDLPNDISGSDYINLRIGELRGSICVLHKDESEDYADIWLIESHLVETWTPTYRVRLPSYVSPYSWFSFVRPLVAQGLEEEVLEDVAVMRSLQKLIHYCLRNEMQWSRKYEFKFQSAHSFAGTLISPTILGGGDVVHEGIAHEAAPVVVGTS